MPDGAAVASVLLAWQQLPSCSNVHHAVKLHPQEVHVATLLFICFAMAFKQLCLRRVYKHESLLPDSLVLLQQKRPMQAGYDQGIADIALHVVLCQFSVMPVNPSHHLVLYQGQVHATVA